VADGAGGSSAAEQNYGASQVAQAFAAAIKSRRLDLLLAQESVAQAATVDRSYFGRLERGDNQPSLGVFIRVAGALSMSPTTLMQDVLVRLEAQSVTGVEN
jgi:transcriptional regulator with XRE-family HTH domain